VRLLGALSVNIVAMARLAITSRRRARTADLLHASPSIAAATPSDRWSLSSASWFATYVWRLGAPMFWRHAAAFVPWSKDRDVK